MTPSKLPRSVAINRADEARIALPWPPSTNELYVATVILRAVA